MSSVRSHGGLLASVLLAVVLWGASNAGTKFLLGYWPPVLTGASRFLAAGILLRLALGWAGRLRPLNELEPWVRRALWLRSGLVLALYITVFQWSVQLLPVSRVGLYLGAAPVWAVLWEQGLGWGRVARRRYLAALLALGGVVILFLPALANGTGTGGWSELLGFSCGWIWTWYGRECRSLGVRLSGAEITAHTMWRAGLILMIPGVLELRAASWILLPSLLWVQAYCVVGGGVVAYWLWNHALRCWPTSRVYLFNNLIPVSTLAWAHFLLGEALTPTFGVAMILIASGVLLGQGVSSSFNERVADDKLRPMKPHGNGE
jgi:drug/metabolite transporter (DMT)-like permease